MIDTPRKMTAAFLCLLALAALGGPVRAEEPIDESPSISAASRARQTADNACSICHGDRGVSKWTYVPSLAGQDKTYIIDQLKDMRARNRTTRYSQAAMWGMAAGLKDEDIEALAAFYAALDPAIGHGGDPKTLALGKTVFERYEIGRPACATCHFGGLPNENLPRLAGQHSEYIARSLRDFHKGIRNHSTMSFMAAKLTDKEMDAVAAYAESLPGSQAAPGAVQGSTQTVEAASAERGALVFNGVGCFQCHGLEGKGGVSNPNAQGGLVPSLTLVSQGYSDAELKNKIRLGVRNVEKAEPSGPAPPLFMPAWGKFLTDRQLDDLVAYLKTLAAGHDTQGF